jgi:hypothetical protein
MFAGFREGKSPALDEPGVAPICPCKFGIAMLAIMAIQKAALQDRMRG